MRSRNFDISKSHTPEGVKVVAKCARTISAKTLASLHHEYLALREISSLERGLPERSYPKPILFREDDCVLFMSALPGVALSRRLKWRANAITGRGYKSWLEGVGRKGGRWLCKFHAMTPPSSTPHNHGAFIEDFQENVARCAALGVSESVLIRTSARAQELSLSLDGNSVSTAPSHGDFLPQNLLVHGTDIGVTDFANYRSSAPIYFDLAAFLAYILLLQQKAKYSDDALEQLANGFAAGYGDRYCRNLVRLYMLNAVLRMVRDHPFQAAARDSHYVESTLIEIVKDDLLVSDCVSVSG